MSWYKKAMYSLLETIIMQGDNGLSLKTMSQQELQEAKELEKGGFIDRVIKTDESGKYTVYMINKDKFDFMGWSHDLGMDV